MANPIADIPLRVFLEGRAKKLGLSPFVDGRLEIIDEPLMVTVYWSDKDRERLFEDFRHQCGTGVIVVIEVIRGVEHARNGAWLDRGWARKLFDACVGDRPLPEDVEVWVRVERPVRRRKLGSWGPADRWLKKMIKRHRASSPSELFESAQAAGEFARLSPPPRDLADAISRMFFPGRDGGYSDDTILRHFRAMRATAK